jgi:hypothetical protein
MDDGMALPMVNPLKPLVKTFNDLTRSAPKRSSERGQSQDFKLVKRETVFDSSEEVVKFLPDILGRALARCWIDKSFMITFMDDPKGTLARYAVFLPEDISIKIENDSGSRPKVVVYEYDGTKPAKRLMYLQLVMMAGK